MIIKKGEKNTGVLLILDKSYKATQEAAYSVTHSMGQWEAAKNYMVPHWAREC